MTFDKSSSPTSEDASPRQTVAMGEMFGRPTATLMTPAMQPLVVASFPHGCFVFHPILTPTCHQCACMASVPSPPPHPVYVPPLGPTVSYNAYVTQEPSIWNLPMWETLPRDDHRPLYKRGEFLPQQTKTWHRSDFRYNNQAKLIRCALCQDSSSHVLKTGRKLVSTFCGHVFCFNCIFKEIGFVGPCPFCHLMTRYHHLHV